MNKLLTYGLSGARLVHITEVENGVACNCVCPCCNIQLVAKNNAKNIKAPHFAHSSGTDCGGAHETAMHLLAKEIIYETKTIKLPDFHHDYNNVNTVSLFEKGMVIEFDKIIVEQAISKDGNVVKPDIIAIKNNKQIYIEFAYSHFSPPEKIEKLKKIGIPSFEVNLSNQELDKIALTTFFLSNSRDKYWLTNPKLDSKYLLVQKQRQAWCELQNKQGEETERLKKEKQQKEAIEKEKKLKNKLALYKITPGIRTIEVRQFNIVANCPLKTAALTSLKTSKFYQHDILRSIIDGQYWNCRFYGHPPNGTYIFLKKNKIQVYPSNQDLHKSTEEQKTHYKFLYAGLKSIQVLLSDSIIGKCWNCNHSVDSLTIEDKHYEICNYPKL